MQIGIRRGTVLIVALAALVSGCSSPDGGDKGAGEKKVAAQGSGQAAGAPSPDGIAGGGAGGGAVGSSTPVATVTFDTPKFPNGKVEVAVMSLQVRGKLAILTVRLTPHLPQGSPEKTNPYELNDEIPLAPELIDTVNLRRYVVVKDNQQKEVQTDDVMAPIYNEQAGVATYSFAAPPANVQSVDVHYGHWPAFKNVPVQR
ncbi:hypothetical protein [Actinomadura montaniterrae]|uniref:DUF4352 domain-containing protein n=1 Tax=Actinomadura montaniterrae TaxID=1803903 RepID=A0A6L3W1V9_9ACTN|nr:hypothetical protein [Actinomadura montaniterrae]KAB2388841.1 hypothetical protein F9B16_02700 [Actinomadura montaniterrae]